MREEKKFDDCDLEINEFEFSVGSNKIKDSKV